MRILNSLMAVCTFLSFSNSALATPDIECFINEDKTFEMNYSPITRGDCTHSPGTWVIYEDCINWKTGQQVKYKTVMYTLRCSGDCEKTVTIFQPATGATAKGFLLETSETYSSDITDSDNPVEIPPRNKDVTVIEVPGTDGGIGGGLLVGEQPNSCFDK